MDALFSNRFSEALQKRNEQLEVQGAAQRRTSHTRAGMAGLSERASQQFGAQVAYAVLSMNWRVSPHCRVVNLVRSGRKQPQLLFASAGVRLASYFKLGVANEKHCQQHLLNGGK